MIDEAHEKSDEILKTINKELNRQYNDAYKHAKEIIALELARLDLQADTPQARFIELQANIDGIVDKIAEAFTSANKAVKKSINDLATQVYKLNYNFMAETLKYKEVNTLESKQAYEEVDFFNVLALENLTDKDVLKRELKSKIVQATLTGKGTRPLLKAVKTEAETLLKDSVRIATTTTTMTESKGRYDIAEKLEKNGHYVTKTWRAIHDSKTRPAHAKASGQTVLANEPFIVGGEKMMFPGDYSMGASIGNTINCRCAVEFTDYGII